MEKNELDLLFTLSGRDKNKVYTLCTENIRRVLEYHESFENRIRKDAFRNVIELKRNGIWTVLEDHHVIGLMNEIASLFTPFQKVTRTMTEDAMSIVADSHKYDSAQDWLKSIKWDGRPRLDTWLCNTYGVSDNEYHKQVGSNWLKGLVKRILYPGCKFDYIMVLEGEQGTKKSTSLSILGGDWYCETFMNTDNKDFFLQFQGKALIEFSEGETLSRTDVKRMKAIITTQTDRFRAPYARHSEDYPRRCVFAMTTNEEEYLKDDTGNRRWLPVKLVFPEANITWLEENRTELFAEAVYRILEKKENVWDFPVEETRFEQEKRMERNPNSEIVEAWYFNELTTAQRNDGIKIQDAWTALHGGWTAQPMKRYDEMILAGTLRGIGLVKRRAMIEGRQNVRWFQKTEELERSKNLIVSKFDFNDTEF